MTDPLLLPYTEIGVGEIPDSASGPQSLVCPRSRYDFLNLQTGQRIGLRCKSNKCFVCGPINARLIAQAQARSNPGRMFRFSLVPTDWTQARLKMKQVRKRMQDLGFDGEWAFSIEPNPSGEDKAHCHGLEHGKDKWPQDVLQDVCQANGLGIPDIRAIKESSRAAGYGIKAAGAAFYGVKTTKDAQTHQEAYLRFLELNGGRISHHTRGFYRLPSGETVTQGQAIAATIEARRAQYVDQEDQGQWHIVEKDLSLPSARLRKLRAPETPTGGMLK